MTRRTFQTITQRWKITDISGAGAGKLRLHQLRNSPTAIKNAIKVIRRCSCVSKRFPIACRSSVVASVSSISTTSPARERSRVHIISYAILNKAVIFFSSPLFSTGPASRARSDIPPSISRLSRIYRDIATTHPPPLGK